MLAAYGGFFLSPLEHKRKPSTINRKQAMNIINTPTTMSSREIAELTGKRHGHVFRDIEKMLKELEISQEGYVQPWVDPQNKQVYHEFLLDRRLTDCLLTGYSAKARIKVIDRWQELEAQQAPQVPQTYAAALLEAGRLALENEQLQLEAKQNAPKVEFFDQVTGSSDTVDMAQAAKVLNMGIGRNKLFELLRNEKVLQGNNQPYQTYIDRGYFRMVESKYQKNNGDTHINIKTVVYQKGLDFICKLIKEAK